MKRKSQKTGAPKSYNFTHLDANDNIFFAKELEVVKSQTYDIKYPEMKARTLIPIDYSVDPGADVVAYEQYDSVGMAKVIASYADDLPRVDVKGKKFTAPIRAIGASYGYSIKEIRRARLAGKPLDQKKAMTARKVIEMTLDEVLAKGNALTGLLGLLNQTNALSYTIPNGASGQAYWDHATPANRKTADEILLDLNKIAEYIVTQTKGCEIPDTELMPQEQYGLIATKPRASTSDVTVLEFFLRTNPYIKNVEPWAKCDLAAANGTKDLLVAYKRDPSCLEAIISQEFEQLPPEQRNLEFVVNCWLQTGGVVAYYPWSIAYGAGI